MKKRLLCLGGMLFCVACSSGDDESPARTGITAFYNPYEVELGFETATVSFASLVPLAEYRGPDLNLTEADCTAAQEPWLRLLNLGRNELSVGGTVWVELRDGVPSSDDGLLLESLSTAMDVTREIVEQGCVDEFGSQQVPRLLIAVESGVPLTTVQWLLRALERVGFTQASLLVDAEQTALEDSWSNRSTAPIVSGTHEVPDYRTQSAYGVVLLDDLSWSQAIERHGQLAAADVGCVAYAWGPEWSGARLTASSPAQTLGKDGQIPVLSLMPVELLNRDVDSQPTQLVTGAACGAWGHLGSSGTRPSFGG